MKFKTGPLAGQTHSIGPGEYFFIGSAESCAIRITDDPTVSPTHACIFYDPSGLIRFKDMGSQFGTFRNGKKIEKSVDLKPGDRITIGQTTTFQSSWWNALQATRLTRFSMIKGGVTRELQDARWYQSNAFRLSIVVVIICILTVINVQNNRSREQRATSEVVVENSSAESKSSVSRDLGIFSGQFSAKLFNSKPKRAARKAFQLTPERQFIWDEIVSISRRFGDPPPSAMDPGFVREVERHIQRFTRNNGHKIMLGRKAVQWPIIEKSLIANNLPTELGYIVWIESNFISDAVSPVGAAGPWQFMPETAKEYGLAVEKGRDQRTDLKLSSDAASRYFGDLIRMFGGDRYLLAIASYNTGQYRVKRKQIEATVNKEKTSDFWQLRHALPKETAEYVPKFIAAIIIGRNPNRWDVAH
jgi:soluble lytic murein transglycosylase-like protein